MKRYQSPTEKRKALSNSDATSTGEYEQSLENSTRFKMTDQTIKTSFKQSLSPITLRSANKQISANSSFKNPDQRHLSLQANSTEEFITLRNTPSEDRGVIKL